MKILFLSQRFLFPMDTGGKIRTGSILRELSRRAEITIISNVEHAKDAPYLDAMDELCSRFIAVPWIEERRYTPGFYARLAVQSLSRYPIAVLNDHSRALEDALHKELREGDYDLVICDFLQSTLNFRAVTGIPVLLFQHNVEAQISRRHVERASNPLARLFWTLQHRRMRRHEGAMCRRFDATIAVSEEDRRLMHEWYGADRVYAIPTGVDTAFFAPREGPVKARQLVFTGSMDWLPNDDAMAWFITDIFPLIRAEEPHTSLVIVGRKPTPRIEKLVNASPDIVLTGWVDDIRDYIAESAVYIVPIRIGGGTRIKIYEALAMGKALVSTTVGAEGLPLEDGEHFLRVDEPRAFADAVLSLLRDEQRRARMGEAARRYVDDNFRWEKVAERFLEICEETADGRPTLPAADGSQP
jgi:sugar transferase (PEP-CTERM/EpsH1 system associated)